MVLSQRHPHAHAAGLQQAISRIEPVRILGIAGAIALNVAALMLLMVPVSAPMQIAPPDKETWYIPEPPKPKPVEPEPVPIVKPQTIRATAPTLSNPPKPQPMPDQDVIVPDGTDYAPPTLADPMPDLGPTLPNPDPLPSTRLEYASAPAPTYPREALLNGIQGTVVLKVLVDVDGKPLSVEIERSSGNRRLDDAARRQVLRKWMFRPAIRDGRAVQVYGIVPVNFSLSLQ
ncbi:MAG: energy transducer TonB [Xanthomonadales bacterium]|jgi:protein TonB|nr:energy transducer TonB [Xanthomonadales bacterium]